jgi:pimeloyl-ACP methyl ester carboxylesterase
MIHYLDNNPDGDPSLLLLHGLGATGESWHFQTGELVAHGCRLIAPDLPGFGRSPFVGGRWSVEFAVEQMIDLMNRLAIPKFFVAGISMGGTVALQLAYRQPQRVEGLILINTFASLRPGSFSEWGYFVRRGWRAFLRKPSDQARIVAERVFPGADQAVFREILVDSIRSADPRVYRQAMIALARFNFTRKLPRIQTPTLVISGDEDTTIPLKRQRELAKRIPNAEQVIIPRAGHAVIADQPERFNREVAGFIARIRSTGRANLPGG